MRADVEVVGGAEVGREQVLVAGVVGEERVEAHGSAGEGAEDADAVGEEQGGFGVDVGYGPGVDFDGDGGGV